MALLHTPAPASNFKAPDFALKNIDGTIKSFENISGANGTVIAFICNHCPYVQAIIERFAETAQALQADGIGIAAIMPNDATTYPADNFENMQKFAQQHNFTFPYLIDESQAVAKSYDAICTPDIFGFDAKGVLQYRGRLDSAGPNKADASTTPELRNAMQQIKTTGQAPTDQSPAMGCSIKWK